MMHPRRYSDSWSALIRDRAQPFCEKKSPCNFKLEHYWKALEEV
jgi:hypothetical protein